MTLYLYHMNGKMSTTKENVIWEEKNLIEPEKNYSNNNVVEPKDITNEIKNVSTKKVWIDIGKVSGIYKIVNKINGKYYVGSSNDLFYRIKHRHFNSLLKNTHPNKYLQNAWNKYGSDNFQFIIVEYVEPQKLLVIEQMYLDKAKINNDSYNLSFDSTKVEMTIETRKKIGNSHRGKFGELASHYGMFHTDETKNLIKQKTIENTPRGKLHPLYDHRIYKFYNRQTNETFIGTQNEFYKRYKLTQSKVNLVVNGIRKSHKNWLLMNK